MRKGVRDERAINEKKGILFQVSNPRIFACEAVVHPKKILAGEKFVNRVHLNT